MANLIVNLRSRVFHDEMSEERCNVDDLRKRGKFLVVDDTDDLPDDYRLCRWCERRRLRQLATMER